MGGVGVVESRPPPIGEGVIKFIPLFKIGRFIKSRPPLLGGGIDSLGRV